MKLPCISFWGKSHLCLSRGGVSTIAGDVEGAARWTQGTPVIHLLCVISVAESVDPLRRCMWEACRNDLQSNWTLYTACKCCQGRGRLLYAFHLVCISSAPLGFSGEISPRSLSIKRAFMFSLLVKLYFFRTSHWDHNPFLLSKTWEQITYTENNRTKQSLFTQTHCLTITNIRYILILQWQMNGWKTAFIVQYWS